MAGFEFRAPTTVTLVVLDAAGRIVRLLAENKAVPAGGRSCRWNG